MADLVLVQWSSEFTSVPKAVMVRYMPLMGVYGFAVYATLISYADWETHQCFPSNVALAKRIGCSERQVRTELVKLQELGFAEWRPSKSKNIKGVWQLYPRPRKATLKDGEPAQPAASTADEPGISADDAMENRQVAQGNLANDALLNRKNENHLNENQEDSLEPRDAQPEEPLQPPPPVPVELPPAALPSIQPQIIEAIDQAWKAANPDVPVPWKGLAFARTKKLLADHPKWTIDHWLVCIRNRFDSDGINPGDPPDRFITDLPRYISGPLDEFGKLQGRTRAHGTPRGDRLAENVRKAIENIRNRPDEGAPDVPRQAARRDGRGDGGGAPFA